MDIIPVIDLHHGQAVHAVRGERSAYRPVVSRLCAGSAPVDVARALVGRCRGSLLYVADLDALQGGEPQVPVVNELLQALPEISIWLDAGFADRQSAEAVIRDLRAAASRVTPVFASEALRSAAELRACCADRRHESILSLDRKGDVELDPAGCWHRPAEWPARVIVMTLDRVGAGGGPDLATLRRVSSLNPHVAVIGAGGLRNADDARAARAAGAHAWLVASALHDLRLDPADLSTPA